MTNNAFNMSLGDNFASFADWDIGFTFYCESFGDGEFTVWGIGPEGLELGSKLIFRADSQENLDKRLTEALDAMRYLCPSVCYALPSKSGQV